jgi:hypothetical protein
VTAAPDAEGYARMHYRFRRCPALSAAIAAAAGRSAARRGRADPVLIFQRRPGLHPAPVPAGGSGRASIWSSHWGHGACTDCRLTEEGRPAGRWLVLPGKGWLPGLAAAPGSAREPMSSGRPPLAGSRADCRSGAYGRADGQALPSLVLVRTAAVLRPGAILDEQRRRRGRRAPDPDPAIVQLPAGPLPRSARLAAALHSGGTVLAAGSAVAPQSRAIVASVGGWPGGHGHD